MAAFVKELSDSLLAAAPRARTRPPVEATPPTSFDPNAAQPRYASLSLLALLDRRLSARLPAPVHPQVPKGVSLPAKLNAGCYGDRLQAPLAYSGIEFGRLFVSRTVGSRFL